jgi:hypothetical protein
MEKRIKTSKGIVAFFEPEFHLLLDQDSLDLKKKGINKSKAKLVEWYTKLGRQTEKTWSKKQNHEK